MASLGGLSVQVNEEGWGPTGVPPGLENVPFAPFSKNDQLGKASDWTNSNFPRIQAGRHNQNVSNVFNFSMDNEDSNFHLVDSRPTRSKNMGQRRHNFQQKRNVDKDDYRTVNPKSDNQRHRPQLPPKRPQHWREQRNMVQYSPSVDIRPEWSVLEQLQVPLLGKMQLQVGPPEDIKKCGTLAFYDRTIDRVTAKNLLPLAKTKCVFRSVSASEDPVLKSVSAEGKARVFITDSVLTALMCTPRSVYSWDIVITRKGNELWFDKRPDSVLDQQTVNESSADGVPEDDTINGVTQLNNEATAILQNFSQQCLDRAHTEEFGDPNPFASEKSKDKDAMVGYRYRMWNLGGDMNVAVRCEVDGMITRQGANQLLSIRTFNQGIVGATDVDWKRKLEHQSAAALAMEVKNNSNRVARWTLAALLAECEVLKVGFVARATPKDNHNHILLVTQMQKPKDLATQLNLNMGNCWAIVKAIIDLCFRLDKDKYLLMKDPNKQLMYLYEVPKNAFTDREDEEDEDISAPAPPPAEEVPIPDP